MVGKREALDSKSKRNVGNRCVHDAIERTSSRANAGMAVAAWSRSGRPREAPPELLQPPFAFPGQADQNAPTIGAVNVAAQDLEPCHPVNQLDGSVMTDGHELGEVADGDGGAGRKSEQRLM